MSQKVISLSNLSPAIFLMGPTASGKTGAAVHCYSKLPVEIISVDSALVFKDMDIGTAKPASRVCKVGLFAYLCNGVQGKPFAHSTKPNLSSRIK